MRATIILGITLDETYLSAEALKRGVETDVVAREVIGDLECRAHDVCRWRDGVMPREGVASHVEFSERRT